MLKKLLVALGAAALLAAPAAAQRVQTLPAASTLTGTEKIVATQGTGCATNTAPCTAVAITPNQIGTFVGNSFQPLDSDLTAIATQTTQPFGRSLLTQASASAAQSALGLAPVASTGLDTSLTGTAWTGYAPTVSASSGTFTTVATSGRWKRIGKTVFVQIRVTITTNGTAASAVIVSLPTAAVNTGVATDQWILTGRSEYAASSYPMVQGVVASNATTAYLITFNNAYPGGSGATINVSGSYEGA